VTTVPQRRGEQLAQRGLGHRHEPAGDRRLARARSGPLDLLTDRFEPDRVTAARQAAEHLAQRHPAQDLAVAEQVIGRHRHLTAAGRTHPRPLDADPTPAQGDRPALTTVAHRGPPGVVSAPRPAHRGHIGLHQGGHHLQAGADREGEQALPFLVVSWRMPNTYLNGGVRRGTATQFPRDPGQPLKNPSIPLRVI
jgi:hypothetical protein